MYNGEKKSKGYIDPVKNEDLHVSNEVAINGYFEYIECGAAMDSTVTSK